MADHVGADQMGSGGMKPDDSSSEKVRSSDAAAKPSEHVESSSSEKSPHIHSSDGNAFESQLDELAKKGHDLREKAAKSGSSVMPPTPQWDYKRPPHTKESPGGFEYKGLGTGMYICYLLVGAIALGFGLGWTLDHFLKTNFFFLVLGFLMTGIGFWQIFRVLSKDQK